MLSEFMEKALEMGCDGIEIEYKDRHEMITAFQGSFGIGIGSVISREAAPLFDEIKELKRKKKVSFDGIDYRVKVSTYESFGEWAYRLCLTDTRTPKTARSRSKD